MKSPCFALAAFAWAAVPLAAQPAEAPGAAIRFEEVGERAGLDFVHFASRRASILPEDNGSGLAFGDYDNDGWDDLYAVNFAGPALMDRAQLLATRPPGRLYHNEGDGTFRDVTEASGLRHVGWDMGAVWADVDADGWLDLIVTGLDEVALFHNEGGSAFRDVSAEAGLGLLSCFATGSALADYDRDGDLDLYVPCYVSFPWQRARERPLVAGRQPPMTTPADYPAQRNYLFVNDGAGHFHDVAQAAGVADPAGRGLQALFADLDEDGWPDLYVGNDQSFDCLFHNRRDGTFADTAAESGTRDPRAGMGLGLGDFDADGLADLLITHWVGEENALYRNVSPPGGPPLFEDVTYAQGLGPRPPAWVGWGVGLVDFELDGDLDVLLVNGSTIEDEWTLDVLTDPKMVPQPLRLYERRGSRYAAAADPGAAFEEPIVGRGASFADFDRDGRVDAAVAVHGGRPLLLRNVSEPRGTWLALQLVAAGENAFAVGAKVTVHTPLGALVGHRLAGEGYLGTHSGTLHFGLGPELERVDVAVRWPSGRTDMVAGVPTGRVVRLREGVPGWEDVPLARRTPQPWRLADAPDSPEIPTP